MKICCDKCEKAIERNVLGHFVGSQTVVIKGSVFRDETIILCKECSDKLREFLKDKGSEENG